MAKKKPRKTHARLPVESRGWQTSSLDELRRCSSRGKQRKKPERRNISTGSVRSGRNTAQDYESLRVALMAMFDDRLPASRRAQLGV